MRDLQQDRREFARFWDILWPALGALFGGTMGGLVGLALQGLAAAALGAVAGGLVGLEIGHLFSGLVKLFFLPWYELAAAGRVGPIVGGLTGAAMAAPLAARWHTGIGWAILVGCFGFICGAWGVILGPWVLAAVRGPWLRRPPGPPIARAEPPQDPALLHPHEETQPGEECGA